MAAKKTTGIGIFPDPLHGLRYELMLVVRSRWLQIFAVAGSGYVLSGGHGLQDFSRSAVSVVQLLLFLTPLAALVFGGLALDPERRARRARKATTRRCPLSPSPAARRRLAI